MNKLRYMELNGLMKPLDSPVKIQEFLDSIPYNTTKRTLSPLLVMKERMAHCMDGGMFAAAALRRLGYPPLIVDLTAENDDDHIIAVFREGGCWGAVAKSNTTVLRFREPVYRTLRELAMSYFDLYYNLNGQKTLRSYSRTIDLSRFDHRDWETTDEDLEYIGDYTYTVKHYPLITPAQVNKLNDVPKYLYDAGFSGADIEGLYKPV
ncbi:MAG: hypothetical protein MUE37_13940 [Bacteroidales bacterium]|nr:hypothetical protein [Bacteroidales bacterium]